VLVNVQLIDAATEGHLWTQDYDRPLSADNIFALQNDLATEIAEKLGVRLTAAEEARLRGGGTGSLRALDLYDEALALRPAAAGNRDASERIEVLLREAIQLDPDFAEAYALLGSTFAVRTQVGYSLAWADSALVLARKALDLDSLHAQGWAAKGTALGQQGRRVDSREALLRALELAPGHSRNITNLASINVELARYEEGLLLAVRSSRLSPHEPVPKLLVAFTNALLGRWDEASDWMSVLEADSADIDLLERTATIFMELMRGRTDAARSLAREWLAEEPESPFARIQSTLLDALEDLPTAAGRAEQILAELSEFDWFDARGLLERIIALDHMERGDTVAAREVLREQREDLSSAVAQGSRGPQAVWDLGILEAIQGLRGEAFDLFDAAVDEGLIPNSTLIGPPETDPCLVFLRDDPRFQEILDRIQETRRTVRERIEVVSDQLRPPSIQR
jgi:tetratricopeptide (TPR) repeat protein